VSEAIPASRDTRRDLRRDRVVVDVGRQHYVGAMADGEASIILKADDVPATLTWYRQLGFRVRASHPEDEPTWAEVARDDLVVQFVAGETPWDGRPALTGTLYVRPGSVDAVFASIKDVVEWEWGVEERPWGARELTLRDPNGYYVTFTEPTAAASDTT
jgi:catechol 2,3-dioxygenase-like lactoylglutathione lyase family enzyme